MPSSEVSLAESSINAELLHTLLAKVEELSQRVMSPVVQADKFSQKIVLTSEVLESLTFEKLVSLMSLLMGNLDSRKLPLWSRNALEDRLRNMVVFRSAVFECQVDFYQ